MTNWEYNVLAVPAHEGKIGAGFEPQQLGKVLDSLGADGWELVGVVVLNKGGYASEIVATLKRPLVAP